MPNCRSCGAPVRWVRTTRGKLMPLDPEPHPEGNVFVDAAGVATVVGTPSGQLHKTNRDDLARELRRSHFVTCPAAAQHRKRGAP